MLSLQARADVPDANRELERLRGFADHEKENREFNQERLSGTAEIKKQQQVRESQQAGLVREYKIWKATEGHTAGEDSPEYREDMKERAREHQESDEARQNYSAREKKFHNEIEQKRPFKECQEYDICGAPVATSVPQKERLLYGNKPDYLTAKLSITGGGNSGSSGSSNNDNDYAPPAPPMGNTGGPEFYEPEIPPPPPPPMPDGGGFDDQVPPPIFDDPGF